MIIDNSDSKTVLDKATAITFSLAALSTFGATAISSLPFHNNSIDILLNGHYDIGYIYDMWYEGNDVIWLAGFGIGKVGMLR